MYRFSVLLLVNYLNACGTEFKLVQFWVRLRRLKSPTIFSLMLLFFCHQKLILLISFVHDSHCLCRGLNSILNSSVLRGHG